MESGRRRTEFYSAHGIERAAGKVQSFINADYDVICDGPEVQNLSFCSIAHPNGAAAPWESKDSEAEAFSPVPSILSAE